MLENRDYMRDSGYRAPMTMLNKLFLALVIVFVVQSIDEAYFTDRDEMPVTGEYFGLSTDGIKTGFLWQLASFNFLHGGFMHILFNCLMFWIVGRGVEQIVGQRRFFWAFLATGMFGGLLQLLLMFLVPSVYGKSVVGASAGVAGVFAIFASIYKNQVFHVYFILPVRAEKLLWVSLAIAGFFVLVPPNDRIAHAAHFGGLLGGMLFVRYGWHHDYNPLPWEGWWDKFKSKQTFVKKTTEPRRTAPARKRVASSAKPAAKESEADVKQRVDQILDKISEKGLNSLTQEERDFLEQARKKM